jgi:hypothetical protein
MTILLLSAGRTGDGSLALGHRPQSSGGHTVTRMIDAEGIRTAGTVTSLLRPRLIQQERCEGRSHPYGSDDLDAVLSGWMG